MKVETGYAVVVADTEEKLLENLKVMKSRGQIKEVIDYKQERDPRYLKSANKFHWIARVKD